MPIKKYDEDPCSEEELKDLLSMVFYREGRTHAETPLEIMEEILAAFRALREERDKLREALWKMGCDPNQFRKAIRPVG